MGGATVLKQVDRSCAEARVTACCAAAPAQEGAGSRGAEHAPTGQGSCRPCYDVQWETDRLLEPAFVQEWQALLADSTSPEPIYQSPAFCQYIRATSQDPHELEILTVRDSADGRLLALTPIRYRDLSLGLQVRHRRLTLGTLQVGTVMGSGVLGDESPAVVERMARFVFAERPRVGALSLPALRQASRSWAGLQGLGRQRGLGLCLLSAWRECHQIPPVSYTHLTLPTTSRV